jgi:hypothetical protein
MLALVLVLAAAPVKVAAIEWSHSGVDKIYAATLEGRYLDLLASNGMRVTSPKDIAAVLGLERQKQMLGCSSDVSCIAELGGALGVDAILYGSVVKGGSSFTVTLRLINARDAQTLSSFSQRLKSEDLLQDWLDAKAKDMATSAWRVLRKGLPFESAPVEAVVPPPVVAEVTPPPATATHPSGSMSATAMPEVHATVSAGHPLRSIAWIPAAVALVGGALGVVGFIEANSFSQALSNELSTHKVVTAQAQSDASTGKLMEGLGYVGVGVFAAGLAVAGFLFFKESSVAPTVMLSPSGAVVGFALAF